MSGPAEGDTCVRAVLDQQGPGAGAKGNMTDIAGTENDREHRNGVDNWGNK